MKNVIKAKQLSLSKQNNNHTQNDSKRQSDCEVARFVSSRINRLLITIIAITSFIYAPASLKAEPVRWLNDQGFSSSQQKTVNKWLKFAVDATQKSFGVLPFDTIDFRVKHSRRNSEPVPWGQVNRVDNSILLHISPYYGLTALKDDWTIYHEVAHLYLPFLDDHDTWLSEGFATYIQHITMMQANVLSQTQAISRIEAGLGRGQENMRRARGSLYRVSDNMHYNRAYMRIYWSGAAYFIEADLALHQQGKKLTTIIADYASCCLTMDGTGKQLVKDLDKLSNTSIFSELYSTYRYRRDFPVIERQALTELLTSYQVE
ncbi:hypothetical protein [Thalassotalea euphylliae]|uniref:Peptidase M61 catalytic domain-containing protein n=1 Tax=Thalassotalea euphylliae TaxID=1655234 RepID=A0A3E0U1N9_9GAMM|nr:hypothetical protein [Thalassotalea euphylliae]REL30629.1 hypothetical protein DXX94_07855 [Thalassotalea euphylliae]